MKIDITIDLDDFTDGWCAGTLNEAVREEIKQEVLKTVKKSPEYKATIKKQTESVLAKIGLDGL